MKRILILFAALLFTFSSSAYAKSAAASLQEMYAEAEFLMVQGDYAGAASKFEAMGAYSDASQMAMYCKAVSAAETTGLYIVAVDALTDLGDFKDSKQLAVYYTARSYEASGDIVDWANISSASDDTLEQAHEDLTSASDIYTGLALFKDCLTRMNSCDTKTRAIEGEQTARRNAFVEKRRTAHALSAHLAGYGFYALRADGTVVTTDEAPLLAVSNWQDIVAISGDSHMVGLKSDGTVVAAGENTSGQCNVEDWKDIAAVSAGYRYTLGLKNDGTVVAVGSNSSKQCDVEGWRNIIAISAGLSISVGLEADGSVVAKGYKLSGGCNVSSWRDIVAVSAGSDHTVGLKADGTVVATGGNDYGQCNVEDWKDIIAINAFAIHTIGLKSDGTIVSTFSSPEISELANIATTPLNNR